MRQFPHATHLKLRRKRKQNRAVQNGSACVSARKIVKE